MKNFNFAKLAMALLLAASVAVLATGCDNAADEYKDVSKYVTYRSSYGDEITLFTYSSEPSLLRNVSVYIKDPEQQNNQAWIARTWDGGSVDLTISGSTIGNITITKANPDTLDDSVWNITLTNGTITDTAITYTVSGTYSKGAVYGGNKNYNSKTITFTKQ